MKTKMNSVPPWTRKKRFNKTNFDDAFSRLGMTNGFINPKEVKTKMESPLVRSK